MEIESTQVYVHRGDWVADCPRDGCANTELMTDRVSRAAKGVFACTNCSLVAFAVWPPEEFVHLADAVLARRPVPDTRNWFPAGHPNATAWGVETGQTVEELRQENAAHGVPA